MEVWRCSDCYAKIELHFRSKKSALAVYVIFPLLAATMLLAGCKENAERFFSGRPSEMAMVHNRIIAGPPEAMVELLQVPSRFPDSTESHIATWQESAIAWWRHPEKHELMIASLAKITGEDLRAFKNWVGVRDRYRSEEEALVLDEIEAAINTIPSLPSAQYSAP